MKRTNKIVSVALSLAFGLAVFTGCEYNNSAANNGWHYGDGAPNGSIGIDGDLYLDYTDWDVWTKENGKWTQRGNIKGETGSKGEEGSKGETGPKGETGVQGEAGLQGNQGATGNGWHYGDGAPEGTLGIDGDLYLDFSSWNVYVKENGTWLYRNNMTGEKTATEYEDYFKTMTMTQGDLLVYNAYTCDANLPKINFALSVQGLFAQIGESKYYYNASSQFSTWLSELKTKYHKGTKDVTFEEISTDFCDHFSGEYVLYDINNAESVNCARTIAGAEQIAMIDKSLEDWAESKHLKKKVDATQMKAESCFDLYKNKLDPSAVIQLEATDCSLIDYTIACKYFCYYPGGDQETNGSEKHPLPPVDGFTTLREKVLSWCSGPVFGTFPLGEYGTVKMNAIYGSHPTIVGAGVYNTTVFNCTEFFGEDTFVQPFKQADLQEGEKLDPEKYPLNKHYVTVINGDGDNIGCWYGGTMDDAKYMGAERGDFPMGWEINPSLYSLAPNIIRHTYDNAKKGDTFVCSISGFGHSFLRYFSDEALSRLTHNLDKYIVKCNLSSVKILDDGSIQDEDKVIEAFSKMKNAEGFYYCTYDGAYNLDHGAVRWANDKPFVSCRITLWYTGHKEDWHIDEDSAESAAARINKFSTDSTTIDGYSYVNLHLWSKEYKDVKKMVELLDKQNVQVVDPDTFLRLIKERVPHVDAAPAKENKV